MRLRNLGRAAEQLGKESLEALKPFGQSAVVMMLLDLEQSSPRLQVVQDEGTGDVNLLGGLLDDVDVRQRDDLLVKDGLDNSSFVGHKTLVWVDSFPSSRRNIH